MRAIDCDQGHDKMHFTAENDEELLVKVKAHAAEYHPEMSEDQVKEFMAKIAYDE